MVPVIRPLYFTIWLLSLELFVVVLNVPTRSVMKKCVTPGILLRNGVTQTAAKIGFASLLPQFYFSSSAPLCSVVLG